MLTQAVDQHFLSIPAGTSRGDVILGLFKCKNSRSNVQLVGTELGVLIPFRLIFLALISFVRVEVSSDVPVRGGIAVA